MKATAKKRWVECSIPETGTYWLQEHDADLDSWRSPQLVYLSGPQFVVIHDESGSRDAGCVIPVEPTLRRRWFQVEPPKEPSAGPFWAFWEYGEYPYLLGGVVDEVTSEGLVRIWTYGGALFRPILLLPPDEGAALLGKLKQLEEGYGKAQRDLRKAWAQKARDTLPGTTYPRGLAP